MIEKRVKASEGYKKRSLENVFINIIVFILNVRETTVSIEKRELVMGVHLIWVNYFLLKKTKEI